MMRSPLLLLLLLLLLDPAHASSHEEPVHHPSSKGLHGSFHIAPDFKKLADTIAQNMMAAKRALQLHKLQDAGKPQTGSSVRQSTSCPDSTQVIANCSLEYSSMYSPSADMASICQSSSTCVSQLQTLSSKYKSTAGCSTDYQAQSVQAWLLQIKYGCVKDGSKYCATTWASATDLSYKDLCSSACFSQYRTIYQEVYGASEAEYLNMVCQKDSKGNYCMDTMTSSETAMSGSMICSECGALVRPVGSGGREACGLTTCDR
ncbi:hypothetical protein GUITHDRAFT_139026 [Guillardia theta CCMP2712]|uniref:Uncharacterized protein n=1 Tax=Guillardia theta (strain CCMP2712) TaxID=905079 RepID=L1JA96_GUITC|nr:hypothetical protein GUITHDRAFT_139026 [Guillardia theta CCMP2712]EKX45463.1 hypothetical protein GUITHDRAFT_139026 [Guillardia theta CCMP2712]|eukprot:XP_005832443.1 hypothetical protein GUITHDRAFT_139026 [Guillardia theta CCMP2712]